MLCTLKYLINVCNFWRNANGGHEWIITSIKVVDCYYIVWLTFTLVSSFNFSNKAMYFIRVGYFWNFGIPRAYLYYYNVWGHWPWIALATQSDHCDKIIFLYNKVLKKQL